MPEYDGAKEYDFVASGEDVSPEEGQQKVPEILLKLSTLEQDEKYQSHESTMAQPPSVLEEDLMGQGRTTRLSQRPGETALFIELPDPQYVSYRLKEYTKALEEWNGMAERMIAIDAGAEWPEQWHECVQGLEYMVFGYKRVASLLQPGDGRHIAAQGINPWDIVQRDVHYLESNCGNVLKKGLASLDAVIYDYRAQNVHSLGSLIKQLMAQGDYQGAITAYENSAAVLEGEGVDFAAHSFYAHALVRGNRFEESLHFISEKLQQEGVLKAQFFEESRGAWQAAMQSAELLLILGEDKKAQSVYLQLDDFFAVMEKDAEWVAGQLHFLNDYRLSPDKYAAFVVLLREYMQYDGRGIPPSLQAQYERVLADFDDIGLDSLARRVMRKTEEQARQWARDKLMEADYLVHEKDFGNARKILVALANLPDDVNQELSEAKKNLSRLEKEEARVKRSLEREEVSGQWENAIALLEAEEYEKAIDAFAFLSGSEYGPIAKIKGEEAIDKLAVRLRKEAAALFVAARNLKEPVKKANMMMRSRDILLYILNKYPGAEIVGKVEQNLQVLEDQIRIFNSGLLNYGK